MHSGIPIPMDGAMTFGAKLNHLSLGNLRAIIIDETGAFGRVMAVQAEAVVTVFQLDITVLIHRAVVMPFCRNEFVALCAIVGPSVPDQIQTDSFSRWGFVEMHIFRRSWLWLGCGWPLYLWQIRHRGFRLQEPCS